MAKRSNRLLFGPRTGKMARVGLGNTGTVQVKHEGSDSRSGDGVSRRSAAWRECLEWLNSVPLE